MKNKLLLILPLASMLMSCGQIAIPAEIEAKNDLAINTAMIDRNGIDLKKVSTGTNSNGKDYAVLSYELDDSIQGSQIALSLSWNEKGSSANNRQDSVSSFVSASIDNQLQKITVTKLQDFDDPIYLTAYCVSITACYAEIKIGLKQKFLGWDWSEISQDPYYSVEAELYGSGRGYSGTEARYGVGADFVTKYGTGFSSVYTDALTESERLPRLHDGNYTSLDGVRYYVEDSNTAIVSSVTYQEEIYQAFTTNGAIRPNKMFKKDAGDSGWFCSLHQASFFDHAFRDTASYFSAAEKAAIYAAEYMTIKARFRPEFCVENGEIGSNVYIYLVVSIAPNVYQHYFAN